MGRRGYPPEFRRRVLDLVESGRKVDDVARDLGISSQSIYTWRRQDRIDRGLVPGLTSAEKAELVAAKRRIAELETELDRAPAGHRVAAGGGAPKRRFEAAAVIVAEGVPAQVVCRVLGVSESGYYAWRGRAPSQRSVRHVWLTDLIRQAHASSRGVYGARRVHAELTLGHGVAVGHGAVELLMRRAGIAGISGRPKWSRVRTQPTASDMVERQFGRDGANQCTASILSNAVVARTLFAPRTVSGSAGRLRNRRGRTRARPATRPTAHNRSQIKHNSLSRRADHPGKAEESQQRSRAVDTAHVTCYWSSPPDCKGIAVSRLGSRDPSRFHCPGATCFAYEPSPLMAQVHPVQGC